MSTQDGKLFVEGQKEDKETDTTYVHRGGLEIFHQILDLSDETEIRSVVFEDGLLSITLGKIVPEHHKKKGLVLNPDKFLLQRIQKCIIVIHYNIDSYVQWEDDL